MRNFKSLFLVACLPRTLVVWGFLSLVLIAGCATMPPPNSSSSETEKAKVSLPVASILKFEDIPVPPGFKLLDKESFVFQNDKNRVALLKYTGGQSADQVVAFYKEQMGSYNWGLINMIEYEKKILNYENSEESCIVTIQPQGGKSTITVALSPRSKPIKSIKSEKDYK